MIGGLRRDATPFHIRYETKAIPTDRRQLDVECHGGGVWFFVTSKEPGEKGAYIYIDDEDFLRALQVKLERRHCFPVSLAAPEGER